MNSKYHRYAKPAAIFSIIIGILFILVSLLGAVGLALMYQSKQPIRSGAMGLIGSFAFSLISGISAYIGIRSFEKERGFRFYNSLFLLAFSILNVVSTIAEIEGGYNKLASFAAVLIIAVCLTLISSISLLLNGVFLLPKSDAARQKKKQGDKGRLFSVVGLIFASISILFIPVLFGPLAVVFGIIAKRKGDRLGLITIIFGICFMIIGGIIGLAVYFASNLSKFNLTPTILNETDMFHEITPEPLADTDYTYEDLKYNFRIDYPTGWTVYVKPYENTIVAFYDEDPDETRFYRNILITASENISNISRQNAYYDYRNELNSLKATYNYELIYFNMTELMHGDAIISISRIEKPENITLVQKQVELLYKGNMYFLTFTDLEERFNESLQYFDSSLYSFR